METPGVGGVVNEYRDRAGKGRKLLKQNNGEPKEDEIQESLREVKKRKRENEEK